MQTINKSDLHLPENVLNSLAKGETVLVVRDHHTVAFLVPAAPPHGKRPYGLCKGEFTVPDDFNDPLPELETLYGEASEDASTPG